MARHMRTTLDAITETKIPVIAAINGDAFGGGVELALACDFRVAAAHARIGLTQINLGLMPAWGASERLAALVGRGRALHVLLGGKVLTADEALAAGLVEEVVPSGSVESRLKEIEDYEAYRGKLANALAPASARSLPELAKIRDTLHAELAVAA